MGNSGGKVPQYEVVEHHQQASTSSASETPRPSAASLSSPSQGLRRPSSPNRQRWAPVQQAPPPPLPAGWDFHIDPASGYPYFYNTRTGVSQWQDPRGPGFALPDRSDVTNLGQRRQVIPPWEGGPTTADPLSWPLPPGWQEQVDQATNQRYYVNYDARILSYNDPRLEIAKAYARGPVVEGVPVHYPPPVIGRPVDVQAQPFEYGQVNPPPTGRPSGQAGTSYLPPPPPLKKKKHSLWSKLGYRHAKGAGLAAGLGAGLLPGLFLFDNPEASGAQGSSSSSSSSSDDRDSDRDEGGESDGRGDLETGGPSGEFSILNPMLQFTKGIPGLRPLISKDGGDDGGDTVPDDGGGNTVPGDDGGNTVPGDDGGDTVPVDDGGDSSDSDDSESSSDSDTLDEYGGDGNDIEISTKINLMTIGSGGASGAYEQSVFGFWDAQATYGYVQQGWAAGTRGSVAARSFCLLDSYTMIAIVFAIFVGAYFGVLEAVLCFLIAFGGRLICLMFKRGRILRKQQRKSGRKVTKSAGGALTRRGSTFVQLKTAAASQYTQIKAWFYEHLYQHTLARMRILDRKDRAGPLYSRLHPRPREITIVTQASAHRLPAIEEMAKSWGGVMCVAIYVKTQAELEQVYPTLCSLHERIEEKGLCRLNICVAKEDGLLSDEEGMAVLYPINAMRNVALSMATTDLVFVLDADFVPSAGMHESLTSDATAYSELLRKATNEQQMFVVPAFEGKLENLDVSQATYPTNMRELREQWNEGTAKAFHCSHFARGHMPTNYENFFNPLTLRPYQVQYREFYEPYTICAREVIPPFDARFRGYGLNKISHAYHCAAIGMKFSVLPQVFVWSLPHFKSQAWMYTFGSTKDPSQKLRILGLYRRFKSELQMLQTNKCTEEPAQLEIKVDIEQPLLPPHHVNMYTVP